MKPERWRQVDQLFQAALEKLLPLVNAELRQLARRYMRRESPGHTLPYATVATAASGEAPGSGRLDRA